MSLPTGERPPVTHTPLCPTQAPSENGYTRQPGASPGPARPPEDGEARALASELAAAFGGMVRQFKEEYQFPHQEAVALAGAS